MHVRLPEDWLARFRQHRDPLRAGSPVPGVEVVKGISAVISKPWHLPGERCESGAGGCCPLGETSVGRGERRVPSARRNCDRRDLEVAAGEEEAGVIGGPKLSLVRHAIFARLVPPIRLYPRTALALLTALNLLNYIDRSVLFAVQDLVKAEFHRSDLAFGLLTSVFFIFYMCAAPFMGPLSLRFSRKRVIVAGALVWSIATLFTAFTKNFNELLIRHTLVGIGEASFVILSPTFVADMFPVEKRGRVMGVFYLAIPVRTALGYLLGGFMGPQYGWGTPFYFGAATRGPFGFLLFLISGPPPGPIDPP